MNITTVKKYILLILMTSTLTLATAQIDDFEDGTTQSWRVGGPGTNPSNIATGGPAGEGDNFLQFSSNGGTSANSRLAIFNTDQWARNYINDEITTLEFDVINLGNTSIDLRIQFEINKDSRVMTSSVNIPAQNDWQKVSFDVRPKSLIGNNAETILQNMTKLWIFHNTAALFPPTAIQAQVGIDNFGVPVVSATYDVIRDIELVSLSISSNVLMASWDESLQGNVRRISVHDASGKRITLSNILSSDLNTQMDASYLAPGIHYVTLSGENILITKSIINK